MNVKWCVSKVPQRCRRFDLTQLSTEPTNAESSSTIIDWILVSNLGTVRCIIMHKIYFCFLKHSYSVGKKTLSSGKSLTCDTILLPVDVQFVTHFP